MNSKPTPSCRSQAIFCRVRIEGGDIARVAQDFNISVARVKKILQEVKRWMRQTPGVNLLESDHETGHTLRQLHLARLEHQWEQLMTAWYRSTQAEETEKVVGDGQGQRKAEKTRRTQTGDVKYLQHAREIMAEMRALSALAGQHINAEESTHVESLTLAQREAALDRLLETLGERARAEDAGGTDSGQNAAA